MYKPLGILLICIGLIAKTYSQQYTFSNYSINDGLSQSVVNCVFQDSKGYIWVGTQNGLNRFNGETFDVFSFNPLDTNSISNNWIYAITEDQQGNLWVGTKGGLNQYMVNQNKFRRIRYQTNSTTNVSLYCYGLNCTKDGEILINTPPLFTVYNPQENSFAHYTSELDYDGSVKDVSIPIVEDENKNIWIGSTTGLSNFSFQTKKFTYFSFRTNSENLIKKVNITALYKDTKGQMWVGTSNGLYQFDPIEGYFKQVCKKYKNNKNEIPENCFIRSIVEDENNMLIVGTESDGLYVLSTNDSTSEISSHYTSENSALGHNIVQSLMIDKSQNLWIGTLQGISKTDLKKRKFQLFRKSNSPNSVDLLGNVIASIYKADDGILWVGTWGQGLNLFNRKTNEVEHYSSQLKGKHWISNDFIHVIYKDEEGLIWMGTRDGLTIFDHMKQEFIPYYKFFNNAQLPLFSDIRINKIIQDRYSNYWIGTQNGLYKINKSKTSFEVFSKEMDDNHRLSANLVYCLLEDADGLIWIATVNGLDAYNPVSKEIQHFQNKKDELTSELVISLCEDKDGQIWIGTSTYVNVYNKKESKFSYFSNEHGLPNNNIFEIISDKNEDLWLGTGKGLCKYNNEKNNFHTFTLEDGLQSLEFNLRAAFVSNDGEILFGGMNGFNSFYPDSIELNPYVPTIEITSFKKTAGNTTEKINLSVSNKIILNDKVNSFTIEFAALEYTNPLKNQYAYKMEGVSDEWLELGNRKFVPFTALKPGEYIFRIKGSNNDGVWNDKGKSLTIIVLPPWWRSIYAYMAYFILLVLIIVIYIKSRERKLKQDKIILEQKVEERTVQIEKQNQLIVSKNNELQAMNFTKDRFFSIIGHDLGNQFHIIVGFSKLLMDGFKKMPEEKLEKHLTNIYNVSKHANDLLGNLLTWARLQTNSIHFNPKKFNVVKKVFDSIDLLEGANLKKNIEIGVFAEDEFELTADANMFDTIIRNLVANAIKFTPENGNITIEIKKTKKNCRISVKDTGVGIPAEKLEKIFNIDSNNSTLGTNGEKGTGLGLILCKEFVEKHKGKIWVESDEEHGSNFIFTMPV